MLVQQSPLKQQKINPGGKKNQQEEELISYFLLSWPGAHQRQHKDGCLPGDTAGTGQCIWRVAQQPGGTASDTPRFLAAESSEVSSGRCGEAALRGELALL